MSQTSFVKAYIIDALYEATILEMMSAKSDEFPEYFALRGRGVAKLIGGDWSSYRRAKMRELAKKNMVVIEYHFGSLVYRLEKNYFLRMHNITRDVVGENSVRLPNPLQLTFDTALAGSEAQHA